MTVTRRLPRVRVSANTLLLIAFLAIFDRGFTLLVPLLAALLHELGHIVVMLCLKIEIRQVSLSLFGAEISGADIGSAGRAAQIAVYAAGAAANLVCGLVAECFGFGFFADCSYALAAVNLLPIQTLDGGCIVAAVFSNCKYGHIIMHLFSGLSLFLLWLASSYLLLLYGGNLSLLMLIVYLFVTIYLT